MSTQDVEVTVSVGRPKIGLIRKEHAEIIQKTRKKEGPNMDGLQDRGCVYIGAQVNLQCVGPVSKLPEVGRRKQDEKEKSNERYMSATRPAWQT